MPGNIQELNFVCTDLALRQSRDLQHHKIWCQEDDWFVQYIFKQVCYLMTFTWSKNVFRWSLFKEQKTKCNCQSLLFHQMSATRKYLFKVQKTCCNYPSTQKPRKSLVPIKLRKFLQQYVKVSHHSYSSTYIILFYLQGLLKDICEILS